MSCERKLENILRTPWASDGKNFSQRIWKDRTQLVNNLQKNLSEFCRSTTAPVVDEDFLTSRRAKNPKTGEYDEIPADMNYKEWKAKYVEGKENIEEVKQEQVKTETPNAYEIKLENKNVDNQYFDTPLESKTSEFDSKAYENIVKKQAEFQEKQADKKIINATKTAKPNPIEPPPDILNEKDLREETQKLFEGFNINAELEDFSEETVRGLNITFTKIKEEIGENIEITTIKTIKSSEKICNQIIQDGYIENKLNEDIKDYKNKEQKKPSDNWIEEKLKEIENNIKESMGLQESKNGKQVLGFYAPKDCKEFKITYGRDREDLSGLYLSEKFINERNSLEYKNSLEAVKNKYWQPPNCDNSNGTINHEIGHSIDDFLGLSDNASKNGIKDLYEADFNRYSNYYSNFLSEYSFYKEINNRRHYKKHPELPSRFREFIAEAISEYLTAPKPREISQKVWNIVKDGFINKRKSK